MSVLVISCGRTGTNIALAMLSGNPHFNPDPIIENKDIFRRLKKYPENYLAKSDVTYLDEYQQMVSLLKHNPQLRLVWTIRDPRDVILSKIRRGQLISSGGDNREISADSTPNGSFESLNKMFVLYQEIKDKYPDRVYLIKMEDIILETKDTSKKVCEFLNIPYDEKMLNFTSRVKNQFKIERYGRKIDTTQVGLWENWETIYNGFFKENNYDIPKIFGKVENMIKYFKY